MLARTKRKEYRSTDSVMLPISNAQEPSHSPGTPTVSFSMGSLDARDAFLDRQTDPEPPIHIDKEALTYIPWSRGLFGEPVIGRKICVLWEDDNFYDAIVVSRQKEDYHFKIVYICDGDVEELNLLQSIWFLFRKEMPRNNLRALEGTLVEFTYFDKKRYRAIVYDSSDDGSTVRVAYIDHFYTDVLNNHEWDVVAVSPCMGYEPDPILGPFYLRDEAAYW